MYNTMRVRAKLVSVNHLGRSEAAVDVIIMFLILMRKKWCSPRPHPTPQRAAKGKNAHKLWEWAKRYVLQP